MTTAVERMVAGKLVDDALAAGYEVSVWDGCEWVLKRSTDRVAIFDAMFSAADDTLAFWKDGVRVGRVLLVHGNGPDVISDWTDNEAIAALVNPALTLAEQQ